ncbi:hypothetical protein EQG49_00260 [Periweissella cryptocerci]|uniref:TraD/TraG TraM recognition site domain-containing protein n=1 Tax=Periweissella cryptocerci TaxID=2506420 RepID=A0A4P6YQV1_9LACO|nr:type IV secretory system conjugative DNA transfer family protein [Periweissella cryptocerci]QBO34987.1 hypothetical protein EQG49_00260 [Periweissella cryptocerci]
MAIKTGRTPQKGNKSLFSMITHFFSGFAPDGKYNFLLNGLFFFPFTLIPTKRRNRKKYIAERNRKHESIIFYRGQFWWLIGFNIFFLYFIGIRFAVWIESVAIGIATQTGNNWSQLHGSGLMNVNTQRWWANVWLLFDIVKQYINPLRPHYELIRAFPLAFLIGLALIEFFIIRKSWRWYEQFRGTITDMASRWTTFDEMIKQFRLVPDRNEKYTGNFGYQVGHVFGYDPRLLILKPGVAIRWWLKFLVGKQRHSAGGYMGFYFLTQGASSRMVTGGSRTKKDESIGYSTFSILSRSSNRPNIIDNDAKAEDFAIALPYLRKQGFDTYVLNMLDYVNSIGYNPMYLVTELAREGEFDSVQEEMQRVVDAMYSEVQEKSSDPFWSNAAKGLIKSGAYALLDIAQRRGTWEVVTLTNISKMFSDFIRSDNDNNGQLINLLTIYFGFLRKMPPDTVRMMALDAFAQYDGSAWDTKSSILSSVYDGLMIYQEQKIAAITSHSTFSLESIGFPRVLRVEFPAEYRFQTASILIMNDAGEIVERAKQQLTRVGFLKYPFSSKMGEVFSIKIFFETTFEHRDFNPLDTNMLIQATKQYEHIGSKLTRDPYSKELVLKEIQITDFSSTDDKITANSVEVRYAERPKAIFLVTPPDNNTYNQLASVFLNQMYNVNSHRASLLDRKKLDTQIVYKFNEAGQMNAIADIDKKVSLGLGQGQFFDWYFQSLSQLTRHYSKDVAEIIKDNSLLWSHILSPNLETNEQISKMLGQQTVLVDNNNAGLGDKGKVQRRLREEKIPLLSADELNSKILDNEMITFRTLERQDKRGLSVSANHIFASDNMRMPYRYENDTGNFNLNHYVADLKLDAEHADLTMFDLRENFLPELKLLADEVGERLEFTETGFIYGENGVEEEVNIGTLDNRVTEHNDNDEFLMQYQFEDNKLLNSIIKPQIKSLTKTLSKISNPETKAYRVALDKDPALFFKTPENNRWGVMKELFGDNLGILLDKISAYGEISGDDAVSEIEDDLHVNEDYQADTDRFLSAEQIEDDKLLLIIKNSAVSFLPVGKDIADGTLRQVRNQLTNAGQIRLVFRQPAYNNWGTMRKLFDKNFNYLLEAMQNYEYYEEDEF